MMKTRHNIHFEDANDMSAVDTETVDLMITSPPYPMIEMWDEMFSSRDDKIKQAFQEGDGMQAYRRMHEDLNRVWAEVNRVLKPGGIACVNIGDATRKIGGAFQLFPNHVKITDFFQTHGFTVLPCILWRKQTNAPNKFMGSGMLPPNAYVTLEHEYILLFRKGKKRRTFKPKAERRYTSVYFWEERNNWFSDLWEDIKGVPQDLSNSQLRDRAAAFPITLPYRLINMFSIYGDTVLDPFWGTGTTSLAAMAAARNSIGYELKSEFMEIFEKDASKIKEITKSLNSRRLRQHVDFVNERKQQGKEPNYAARHYDFSVVTKREGNILFRSVKSTTKANSSYIVEHEKFTPSLDNIYRSQTRLLS